MVEVISKDKMSEYAGKEIGVSDWYEIKQDRINGFADVTEDHQWIHVDEDAAKNGPFGSTIAHGFLVLSLVSYLGGGSSVIPEGMKAAINYGLNKVRFINPVHVNSKVRDRVKVKEVLDKGEGRILVNTEHTMEIEGQERPAMVAETLTMFFT
jgi:acyl dehydratase